MKLTAIIIMAYFLGSVNFAIIIFKALKKDDPRKGYSGNPGVTNVYRQAGPLWAAAVLILDLGRAMAVSFVSIEALRLGQVPWAGLALIIGNRFPCFHGFKGGKGVANYLGFSAVVAPLWAGISALIWVIVFLASRIPFIASFFMLAILAAGMIVACGLSAGSLASTLLTVILIIYNHRKNIGEFMHKKKFEEPPEEKETPEG